MTKNTNKKTYRYFITEVEPGKVYFNYERAPYLCSKLPVVIAAVIELAILVFELILFRSAYLQLLTIPIILFLIYRILKRKEDVDKATESLIVTEQLDPISELVNEDGELVAEEYFIVIPKEVYLKEKRFLLAVFSNGVVYRFGVENAEHNGFVLDKKATVCTDNNELALVKKYTKKLDEDKNAKAKRITGRVAAGIIIFGIIVIALAIFGSTTLWGRIVELALLVVFLVSFILSISLDEFRIYVV